MTSIVCTESKDFAQQFDAVDLQLHKLVWSEPRLRCVHRSPRDLEDCLVEDDMGVKVMWNLILCVRSEKRQNSSRLRVNRSKERNSPEEHLQRSKGMCGKQAN